MPKIIIELPKGRLSNGSLTLKDDNGMVVAGPFSVKGKSDNAQAAYPDKRKSKLDRLKPANPLRDPLKPFGDMPTGEYRASRLDKKPPSADNLRMYGPNEVIRLDPQGGDALTAAENGRTGLLIHGGELSAPNEMTGKKQLRPTNGCARIANEDMAIILSALRTLSSVQSDGSMSDVIVEVSEYDAKESTAAPSSGIRIGDPPSVAQISSNGSSSSVGAPSGNLDGSGSNGNSSTGTLGGTSAGGGASAGNQGGSGSDDIDGSSMIDHNHNSNSLGNSDSPSSAAATAGNAGTPSDSGFTINGQDVGPADPDISNITASSGGDTNGSDDSGGGDDTGGGDDSGDYNLS